MQMSGNWTGIDRFWNRVKKRLNKSAEMKTLTLFTCIWWKKQRYEWNQLGWRLIGKKWKRKRFSATTYIKSEKISSIKFSSHANLISVRVLQTLLKCHYVRTYRINKLVQFQFFLPVDFHLNFFSRSVSFVWFIC